MAPEPETVAPAQEPEGVHVEEHELLAAQLSNLRRRLAAESERAELTEAAFVKSRREIVALRQQVADRDEEIRVLREKLDAPAPLDEPAPAG